MGLKTSLEINQKWIDGLLTRIQATKDAAERLEMELQALDRYRENTADVFTSVDDKESIRERQLQDALNPEKTAELITAAVLQAAP